MTLQRAILLALIACTAALSSPDVRSAVAFNATSTNFYLRGTLFGAGGGNATSSFSTSTSFRTYMTIGGTAGGTSTSATSFNLYGGFLYNLFKGVKPTYEQIHYHWRNDDGSETTATSATSNTPNTTRSSLAKSTGVRVRFGVSNEGGTEEDYASQQFRIEYGLKSTTCAAIGAWTDVGAVGGDWDMFNSSNITEGGNTTNIAVSTGGVADENHTFYGTGGLRDTTSATGATFLPSDTFMEIEYSIQATSAATDGATYCFRLTNAGSTSNFTYTRYAEASIAGSSLTLSVSTDTFPSLTPGTARFATSTVSVNTSNSTGWSVSLYGVDRVTGNTTMDLSTDASVGIPDQTEWIAGLATTSAGNAVRIASLSNSGDVLAFRVMTASGTASFRAATWWGSTDAYSDNVNTLWAGFASSSAIRKDIGNSSISSGGGPVLSTVLYYLDVPSTQQAGTYTGDIVYTAVANP